MKKRLTYEAPEVELVLVRFEENFLGTGGDTTTTLGGMMTGGSGANGYNGDAFDSSSNHHDL